MWLHYSNGIETKRLIFLLTIPRDTLLHWAPSVHSQCPCSWAWAAWTSRVHPTLHTPLAVHQLLWNSKQTQPHRGWKRCYHFGMGPSVGSYCREDHLEQNYRKGQKLLTPCWQKFADWVKHYWVRYGPIWYKKPFFITSWASSQLFDVLFLKLSPTFEKHAYRSIWSGSVTPQPGKGVGVLLYCLSAVFCL